MTHDGEKSDRPVVPEKGANNERGRPCSAERLEGRGLAKENSYEQTKFWTQGQVDLTHALERIRDAARRDGKLQFSALWHHVYNVNRLRQAYFALKRDASAGIDGVTWRGYGEHLEENLKDLSTRVERGSYKAQAVKRVYIPKPDGRERPLGVTALEDKIVQRATVEVLNAVYEADFKGFSHGFRPGRNQHNALDAVTVAIEQRKVSWVLDADIRGFFDTLNHEWLMKFIGHRICDKRVHRFVMKWLKAGVLEQGELNKTEEGVPQGGSISPLLANIYLHYVLDLWADSWRKNHARGEVCIIRYADDFIVGFQYESDAKKFHAELSERLAKFNLELNDEKTRLMRFGRFANDQRNKPGGGKPETFNFLGFTHICGKTRSGKFCVLRKTMAKRVRAKLAHVKTALRLRMHRPLAETGAWLNSVLLGHYQYYGVPRNLRAMQKFRRECVWLWRKAIRRRSDKKPLTWERMFQYAECWLSCPRIVHPYPNQRLNVTIQGRSPVR